MTGARIHRALVVDDEPDIRTVAEMSLSTIAGWRTRVAASGDEALEIARGEAFDVVLLDMMMPGRDGLSTLRALRALPGWKETPVVMVTAKTERHQVESYLSAGAVGVIAKPFDPMKLAGRIRDLVGTGARQPLSLSPRTSERLAALRDDYLLSLEAKFADIRERLGDFDREPSEESFQALRRPVHKLHGTAGSYGFSEVSAAAGILEAGILDMGAAVPSGSAGAALQPALTALREVIEEATALHKAG